VTKKGHACRQAGFTLVELVVVVTIIMVLTAVGAMSFQNANAKARDGRRKADLEKIRLALEMIRQVGDTYPASETALYPTYLPSWPEDPKAGQSYTYTRVSGYSYTLDAKIENTNEATGSYTGCGGTCNYRVTNP
jgi:prepilin-type N-terminal cleavage/methylation domain-containing protein